MPKKKSKIAKQSAHHLKKWLWGGTAIFAALIILIWGWNLRLQVSNVSWQGSPEEKMVAGAKIKINDIVAETKDKQVSLDQVKWQIQNIISELSASSTTSTIPSSTILTASSSPKISTTSLITSSTTTTKKIKK